MRIIYVDVDDTLIRSFGSKRIPITAVVHQVRQLHRLGATLYCWSFGGAEYARATAAELGLSDCFELYLAKPHAMIDDQEPKDWRLMRCLHPNLFASLSSDELLALTTGEN